MLSRTFGTTSGAVRLDRVDDAGAAALIRPGLPYFERSRLATSMRPFVETFPTEHILILGSDVEDAGQLSAISAFLGLPGPRTDVRIGRKNETSAERSYTPALRWIVDRGLVSRAERLVPQRMRPFAARALLRPPVEAIDERTVRSLMSVECATELHDEHERFEVLTTGCQRFE